MAGLTDDGFEAKDLATVLEEIEEAQKNSLGQNLNVRPTSVLGVLNGVIAAKIAELWEVSNEVYASQFPDTAEGTSLDQLCLLTGCVREEATKSTVTLSLTGTPSTPIPAGQRVKNTQTNTYWTNALSGSIGASSATTIAFEAEETGPVVGAAGTITSIETPVSGWTAVTNPLDAEQGQDVETDAELRLRRSELLTASGKGTLDAILADVLAVEDVTEAYIFENTTLVTDADNIPGKAFEVVVLNGDVDDIAQAIWDSKPAGISAYGATTGTAVDALDTDRVVGFTRPTQKNVYISVSATTGTGWLTALSADFAQAIVDYADENFGIGDDVIRREMYAPMFTIAGIVDIPTFYMDFFASPTGSSNLTIGSREIAVFDTSRIGITAV